MGVLIAALFLSGIPAKAGPVVYWADLAAENGNRIDLTTGQNETFQIQSQDVASSFASPALAIDETNGEVLTTYNRFKDGILTEFIIPINADGSGV